MKMKQNQVLQQRLGDISDEIIPSNNDGEIEISCLVLAAVIVFSLGPNESFVVITKPGLINCTYDSRRSSSIINCLLLVIFVEGEPLRKVSSFRIEALLSIVL